MAHAFKLPDLGEGIHEGEIVDVFVKPGDRIKEGDPLLEVETDKAVTAIPSPFTGTVAEVRVAGKSCAMRSRISIRPPTCSAPWKNRCGRSVRNVPWC